jgi:hypothetical protein
MYLIPIEAFVALEAETIDKRLSVLYGNHCGIDVDPGRADLRTVRVSEKHHARACTHRVEFYSTVIFYDGLHE